MQKKKQWRFLIVGLGDIGSHILEFLARSPAVSTIRAVDLGNTDDKLRTIYSAEVGAAHQGLYPQISFQQVDVSNVDQIASCARDFAPDCVISATSLLSWWVPQANLPLDVFRRVDEAGFGPWFPLHFALLHSLMSALREAEIRVPVVNCSYPDVTNAALAGVDLAPTVGVGNCDLFFPEFKWIAARELGCVPQDVDVYFVGDHFLAHVLNQFQDTHGVPYLLKVFLRGSDVTDRVAAACGGLDRVVVRANQLMPRGSADHFLVAASAVKNALGLLEGSAAISFSPGPTGLPGGYPIRFTNHAVKVHLPDGTTLEDAMRINRESARGDGIEGIQRDGTVVLTEKAKEIMTQELGFTVGQYKPSQCMADARALLDSFWRLVGSHK